jgi:hypothetical protein
MVLTDWHRLLAKSDGYQTRPPATAEDLARHETLLGATLPLQLRKLYLVSDGVFDVRGHWFVIWPLAELPRRNEAEWAVNAPARQELLAFGDDGTGVPFCVPRDGRAGVFIWNPLAAAPNWLANDAGDFWTGWTTGAITTSPCAA